MLAIPVLPARLPMEYPKTFGWHATLESQGSRRAVGFYYDYRSRYRHRIGLGFRGIDSIHIWSGARLSIGLSRYRSWR